MNIETALVPEADYDTPPTQSVVAQRTKVKIAPKYGGEFGPGQILRLEIPSQNWLDPESLAISFTFKTFTTLAKTTQVPAYWNSRTSVPTNNTFCHPCNGIQTIFNRFKLLQASNVIEDIQEYGKLTQFLQLTTAPLPWLKTSGLVLEGLWDPTDQDHRRLARGFGSAVESTLAGVPTDLVLNRTEEDGKQYYIHLNSGLLARAGKYLMTKLLGVLTIELYMETASACLVSSVGLTDAGASSGNLGAPDITYPAPTYEIKNVYLHCQFLVPIDSYDRQVVEMIEQGEGVEIHYDSYSQHTRQTGIAGASNLQFQERAVSVKGGFAVMIYNWDLNDLRTDNIYTDAFISKYRWRLGSQYIPAQDVEVYNGAPEAWAEVQDMNGTWADSLASASVNFQSFSGITFTKSNPILATTAESRRQSDRTELLFGHSLPYLFCVPLNLEKTPGQLSGFNTSATNTDIELQMTFGNEPRYSRFRSLFSWAGNTGTDNAPVALGDNLNPDVMRNYFQSTANTEFSEEMKVPGYMIVKATTGNNDFVRVLFWAHDDMVFKVSGIGSIQILK